MFGVVALNWAHLGAAQLVYHGETGATPRDDVNSTPYRGERTQ
jgi:hypothetical protein